MATKKKKKTAPKKTAPAPVHHRSDSKPVRQGNQHG